MANRISGQVFKPDSTTLPTLHSFFIEILGWSVFQTLSRPSSLPFLPDFRLHFFLQSSIWTWTNYLASLSLRYPNFEKGTTSLSLGAVWIIELTIVKAPKTDPVPGGHNKCLFIHFSCQSAVWSALKINIMRTYYEPCTKLATGDTKTKHCSSLMKCMV